MSRLDSIDEILLERIGKGDEDAFGILFRRYYVRLCRYAVLFVKEKEASEEIIMNLFVWLWENRSGLGNVKSPGSYLFRSVRNRCINWLRDARESLNIDECLKELVSCDDSSIELQELNRFIEEAVLSLPERCRMVFTFSRMENMSHKEIASRMNISTKTVEAQITKALGVIRRYVAENI